MSAGSGMSAKPIFPPRSGWVLGSGDAARVASAERQVVVRGRWPARLGTGLLVLAALTFVLLIVLPVAAIQQRSFDVLFSANKRIITPLENIATRVQLFHGVSFRNRGVRPENLAYTTFFVIGPYMRRKASSAVISALSCCVTCGACQAVVRCSAVLRRMFDIGTASTSPQREKSGSGARAFGAPPASAAFTCAFTSS